MRKRMHRSAFLLALFAVLLLLHAPAVSAAEGNIEDYHTILVNPWNKMPENYSCTLKTVTGSYKIDKRCHADLKEMLSDCRKAGYEPHLCSAYRTNYQQTYLFNNKVQEMRNAGYGANSAKIAAKSIAVPGTSEHQLGLAVDIIDSDYPYLNTYQENQDTQKWLMKNSWKYGFTLRYPKGKSSVTGIIYEPWHYRYVGHYLAEVLYTSGLTLEEYLENVPSVPTVTGSHTASGKIKLKWKADKKAVKYEIYRRSSKSGEFKKLTSCSGASYEDTSVSVGKTYEYKVRAISKNGAVSDFSDTDTVTCRPAAPVLTGTNTDSGMAKLSWKAVKNAEKYEIYRRSSKNGAFSKHTTTTGTKYENLKLTVGKTYEYKVRTVTKSGTKSAFSNIVSVTCRPAKPVLSGSNNARGTAKLTWKSVGGAVKYEVYRRDGKTESFFKLTTRTGTSFDDLSLKLGKTYEYKVCAVSKDGTKSEFSKAVSVTCRPAKPALTAALNARGKVKLTWKAAENAVQYEIYRRDPKSEKFLKITARTGTSYENIAVKAGKTYEYKVRAVSKDGTKSAFSNTVSVTAK